MNMAEALYWQMAQNGGCVPVITFVRGQQKFYLPVQMRLLILLPNTPCAALRL